MDHKKWVKGDIVALHFISRDQVDYYVVDQVEPKGAFIQAMTALLPTNPPPLFAPRIFVYNSCQVDYRVEGHIED